MKYLKNFEKFRQPNGFDEFEERLAKLIDDKGVIYTPSRKEGDPVSIKIPGVGTIELERTYTGNLIKFLNENPTLEGYVYYFINSTLPNLRSDMAVPYSMGDILSKAIIKALNFYKI